MDDCRFDSSYYGMISKALNDEWQKIVYYNRSLGRALSKCTCPGISICDLGRCHGRYIAETNTIELNSELVFRHPWYAVLDVYFHELAHAIAHMLKPEQAEAPHGAFFREICRLIGASPDATVSYTALDERLATKGDTGDALVEKVRKLLVLAEKGDEHEAEVALSKAVEIMARYGLDKDSLEEQKYVTVAIGPVFSRMPYEELVIAEFISSFFKVRYIMASSSPMEEQGSEHSRRIYYSGTLSNVRIGSYVYDSLHTHIENAWRLSGIGTGVRAKRDFTVGVIEGLKKKLTKDIADRGQQALIHVGDGELDEYYHSRYPGIRSVKRGVRSRNYGALEAGRKAAEGIDINPGIEKGAGRALGPGKTVDKGTGF